LKVGLLECDDVVGRFPEVEGGYREMFAALLPEFDFSFFPVHRNAFPENPGECDAWMCSGSKYSVYEKHEWLERLSGFLRNIRRAGKPFVGICFGHQMLAHALGGEVAKARQGWGAGVLPVEVLKQEPWMRPWRDAVRIQHMHQDQVQRLPSEAVLLARSPHCEVAMFRVGATMLGIEGHPEFTVPYARALIDARRKQIGEPRATEALAGVAQPDDGPVVGGWIAAFVRDALVDRP
jgi:GMP synthase-like glutamine amidotransferase